MNCSVKNLALENLSNTVPSSSLKFIDHPFLSQTKKINCKTSNAIRGRTHSCFKIERPFFWFIFHSTSSPFHNLK
jgi:hypothetical protein